MSTELIERPRTQQPQPSKQAVVAIAPTMDAGQPITVLVRQTGRGIVKSTFSRVKLDPQKGEVYYLSAKDPQSGEFVKKPILTAAGYYMLNRFSGVSFASPDHLFHDGRKVGNPYFGRDDNGDIEFVKVRRVGIGRSNTGNLVAWDLVTTLDVNLHLAQDLLSRWTGRKNDTPKPWAEMYSGDNVPADVLKDPKRRVVRCPGNVVLSLDLSAKEVVNLIAEHCNRVKFCERIATTVCERNILKKFLGVAQLDKSLRVPVVSWMQTDWSMADISRIAESAGEGRVDLGDEEVEVIQEAETVDDKDEVDAVLSGEFDEETHTPQTGDPLEWLKSEITSLCNALPSETVNAEINIGKVMNSSDEKFLQATLEKLQVLIDEQNETK